MKLESQQITNSFKARGAFNALLSLLDSGGMSSPVIGSGPARSAGAPPVRVVTASAGNHGRAVAWAARELGVHATIFTPRDAAETKLAAIRRHRADLRPVGENYEDAERLAKEWAASSGAIFVSAYSDPNIIAGTGTIALEIFEDLPGVDFVVVPVGGGGLIGGIAATLKTISRDIRVIGVEAAASPVLHASLQAGHVVQIEVGPTIADGLAGNMDPETITFELIRRFVDDVILVSEEDLRNGIRGLVEHEHLIAEGAGVAAIASVLSGRPEVKGQKVAVVVSGSNIDLKRLAIILRS